MQRRPLIAAAAAAALFPKSSFTQTHDVVDVLVAGSGLAGHAAAIAAREEGAERVLVIEKGPVIGGHSAYSSGSLAVFSPALQNEQNLSDPIEEWLKDSLDIGGKINEPVVRAIIEESEAAFRWLSSMGVDFSPSLFLSRTTSIPSPPSPSVLPPRSPIPSLSDETPPSGKASDATSSISARKPASASSSFF